MTGFLLSLATLNVAAPPSNAGLPSDRLEAYAEQVQINRKSCGPTALWYCLRQFGIEVDRQSLCREADLQPDGTALESLLRVSNNCGLQAQGIVSDAKNLDILPVPSIIIVDKSHCVVYQGIESDGDTVRFFEPATGRNLTAPREKVVRNWTGEAIVFDRPRLSTSVFWIVATCAAIATGLLTTCVLRVVNPRDSKTTEADPVTLA
jgi:hypothetical protein